MESKPDSLRRRIRRGTDSPRLAGEARSPRARARARASWSRGGDDRRSTRSSFAMFGGGNPPLFFCGEVVFVPHFGCGLRAGLAPASHRSCSAAKCRSRPSLAPTLTRFDRGTSPPFECGKVPILVEFDRGTFPAFWALRASAREHPVFAVCARHPAAGFLRRSAVWGRVCAWPLSRCLAAAIDRWFSAAKCRFAPSLAAALSLALVFVEARSRAALRLERGGVFTHAQRARRGAFDRQSSSKFIARANRQKAPGGMARA